MGLKSYLQADLTGKTVLVRADLNVPFKGGDILDDTRIQRFLPTLSTIQEKAAKIIILSHFGRPKGQAVPEFSLKPVADRLSELGYEAELCSLDSTFEAPLILLENLRFHPGEEANDPAFSQKLASLGDIYINDAFSVSHRAHASIEGITHCLPSYAGPQLLAEVSALENALQNPKRPLMAIVAGAKVSTKLGLLKSLSKDVDILVIAGGLAHTFLAAKGFSVGKDSLCEEEMIPLAREILETAPAEIILPEDIKVAAEVAPHQKPITVPVSQIPEDKIIVDMGEETLRRVKQKLSTARTLIWNGLVGIFEVPPFDESSMALAKHVALCTKQGTLYSLAGGGETVAGLNKAGVLDQLSYVSTAGGAFLEFLEGKDLPGIKALQ